MANKAYLLGTGLTGFEDFKVSDSITIRDAVLNEAPRELARSTNSQHEFGLLCAAAKFISFEVEFLGKPEESATALGWNFQWDLCFLSIISDAAILWPFGTSASLREQTSRSYSLTNSFNIGAGLRNPERVKPSDLKFFLRNRSRFTNLIGDNSFSTAVSIAAIYSRIPNPSLSMAIVWSGIEAILGFDHELRFRIALGLTHLLADQGVERLETMRHYSSLYDDRSKCVHGSKKPKNLPESLSESKKILRDLILLVVERGKLITREDWDKRFLNIN